MSFRNLPLDRITVLFHQPGQSNIIVPNGLIVIHTFFLTKLATNNGKSKQLILNKKYRRQSFRKISSVFNMRSWHLQKNNGRDANHSFFNKHHDLGTGFIAFGQRSVFEQATWFWINKYETSHKACPCGSKIDFRGISLGGFDLQINVFDAHLLQKHDFRLICVDFRTCLPVWKIHCATIVFSGMSK